MKNQDLVPGNLFMVKETGRCYMLLDNKSFAIGSEGGDVNKRSCMEISCGKAVDAGGLWFESPDEVVFLDASLEEKNVINVSGIPYGSFFMHEGLGEVLVKSILRCGKYDNCYVSSLCARAKDGQLVLLPDSDVVVATRVTFREVPEQELAERETARRRELESIIMHPSWGGKYYITTDAIYPEPMPMNPYPMYLKSK